MSAAEVQQLLNLPSHLATDAFLKQHGAYLPYTLEDIQQDIRAIDQVLSNHDHHPNTGRSTNRRIQPCGKMNGLNDRSTHHSSFEPLLD
jgi:hypothetical protein